MIVFASITGGFVVGGFALLMFELTRREQALEARARPLFERIGEAGRRKILLAAAAGIAMLAMTGWPVAALAAALGALFVPVLTSTRSARQRTARLEGLEQWTRRLSDLLTASRGLEEALEISARTAPTAISGQVTALARRLSARVGTQEALRAFANEIDDAAGDRIVAALLIATGQRGGGVQGVLSALAELLARDVAARREIEASRAEHRTTLRWITAFMGGFTVFAILNRSYSAPYGTFEGEAVLALIASLYAAGLASLHKLGQIPGPSRFLDLAPITVDEAESSTARTGGGW
jgi:Flp pilus assembly protein TadB